MERKLAAILSTDVKGYSRLMGEDEVATIRTLTAYRDLMATLIQQHRGRVVDSPGDNLLAEFASVVEAVQCAVAIQRELRVRNAELPAHRRMEFRIGINLGDVIVEEERIYGDGVNIAARLEALAEPGGVLVSQTVHEQVRDKLPFTFEDLGEQQVKNIARPLRVYRLHDAPDASGTEASDPPALALPDKPSIAVLPFQNISDDTEQEYFADGISEDIITALSKVRWFFVVARNSSFTYKGKAVDVKQVSRELGVRYALEGSVRKAGNRFRITAQLIDATTGNHVWAERYDRELTDIFAVQDEITERVVAAIEPQLYAAEHFRSQRKPPESLDAWECVVRALSFFGQGTRAGDMEAEALCRRAIAIAPSYGQAHSLLAWMLARHATRSGDLRAMLLDASAEARTALGFDEQDPWAHLAYGMVLFRGRRHSDAERAVRRALDCNPNFALAHASLGWLLAVRGAHEEAIGSAEYALRLSPSDPRVGAQASHVMAFARFAAGRYEDSVAAAREMIERYPEYLAARYVLIAAAAMQGEGEAAGEALAALLRLQPDFSLALASEVMPWAGEIGERLLEGWRRAGVPEQ
jgi:TolB-like protein/class 3 adenylate cyclase/Flp pilus assembly protein TadD